MSSKMSEVGPAGRTKNECYYVNQRDPFTNINESLIDKNTVIKHFSGVYNIGIGVFFIYILSKLMSKR